MLSNNKNRISELVLKSQKMDKQAMSELIELIQDDLLGFCFYLCANKCLAEDLCQEVLIKVLININDLKKPQSFKSWIFKTAKNLYINHMVSPKISKTDSLNADTQISYGIYEIPELIHDIAKTLSFLSEEDKLALLLVDYHGYSYEEAADIIGISEAALTSRIFRAREEFSKKFENT